MHRRTPLFRAADPPINESTCRPSNSSCYFVQSDALKAANAQVNIDELYDMHEDISEQLADLDELNDVMSRTYEVGEGVTESDLDAALDALADEVPPGGAAAVAGGAGVADPYGYAGATAGYAPAAAAPAPAGPLPSYMPALPEPGRGAVPAPAAAYPAAPSATPAGSASSYRF